MENSVLALFKAKQKYMHVYCMYIPGGWRSNTQKYNTLPFKLTFPINEVSAQKIYSDDEICSFAVFLSPLYFYSSRSFPAPKATRTLPFLGIFLSIF